ncbi:MAG: cation:proton antiporter [Oligoflexia bacterium]|nr:cation:proton antiporter [Oligoflexia bacterium]
MLQHSLIYLTAAVVMVPLFQFLGLGSVLGYLIGGILIGPYGFGFISGAEEVLHFSEIGVVLLLFLIGLELNPRKLWNLRRPLIGMGGAQVVVTAGLVTVILLAMSYDVKKSIVIALGFALSSTAVSLSILRERNRLNTAMGKSAFSVLLFQDLAVIPLMAFLPWLAGAGGSTEGIIPFRAIGAVLLVAFLGRFLLRPVFRLVAQTNLREVFTAFSLLLVLGIAALMQSVGVSMALGSFLAGVLLADSEYRHELEIDIEPFKGLLLGLFFIAIGMSIDLSVVKIAPGSVVLTLFALLAAKIISLMLIAKIFRFDLSENLLFAIILSQGGEFAFVLYSLAQSVGLITSEDKNFYVLIVALSMATTPVLLKIYEQTFYKIWSRKVHTYNVEAPHSENNPVIIAGFGRFGQVLGRILHTLNIGTTVLDYDPGHIEFMKKFGWKSFYGDVTRLDLLEAAGAATAKILVIAIKGPSTSRLVAELVRERFPHLKLFVRVETRPDAYAWINESVPVYRDTLGSSLEMAEDVLKSLGFGAYEARKVVRQFRTHDEEMLRRSARHAGDDKTLLAIARQSREDLRQLMEDDVKRMRDLQSEGWG